MKPNQAPFTAGTVAKRHRKHYIEEMKTPAPTAVARAERMRRAEIEGKQNRAQYEAEAVAVRRNMERLRALRLAKEATEVAVAKPAGTNKTRRR